MEYPLYLGRYYPRQNRRIGNYPVILSENVNQPYIELWYNRGRQTSERISYMARKKRLNINNTDRYFNIQLMLKDDITNKIKVTRLNEDEIEQEMDELAEKSTRRMNAKNDKSYILYQEKYNNDTLIHKLLNYAGSVTYYSTTIVPYYVTRELAKNLQSEVVYPVKPYYEPREIENIQMNFTACPVSLDCPVVIPDISPYDILFAVHPLKTSVDKIRISFPALLPEEIQPRHKEFYYKAGDHYEVLPHVKYRYFKYIQTSLSLWKMNIWLVCDSEEDKEEIQKLIDKDQKKRSPGAKGGTAK